MKKRLLALLCAFLAAGAGQSFIPSVEVKADEANTYYISSLHGDTDRFRSARLFMRTDRESGISLMKEQWIIQTIDPKDMYLP